jgi:hydroxymethylglutaryl-CoA synthase
MKIAQKVGITAYGTYLPAHAIAAEQIELAQGTPQSGIPLSLGVKQKTFPSIDEDTITMATAAGAQALSRCQGDATQIGALFIGSESHPYAVKPSGTVVKAALGLSDHLALADLQFACKAGTQSLQACLAYVAAGFIPAGMGIGADTAQSRPGDMLEFTAGAGAAAYVIDTKNLLATVLATTSVATDTPDFWRRAGEKYPHHAGRFSGEAGYFHHVALATTSLLSETNLTPQDIDFCVFHTPNAKFPIQVAKQLGFSSAQLAPSLIVQDIGNTYAAASLLALAAVLDQAPSGAKILVTSYGSGAGADSFLLETTPLLVKARKTWSSLVSDQISQLTLKTYQEYQTAIAHLT